MDDIYFIILLNEITRSFWCLDNVVLFYSEFEGGGNINVRVIIKYKHLFLTNVINNTIFF